MIMIKNKSKSKIIFAVISLVITFFVWQQGLRDSLNRPSVSFDISQKEREISELAVKSIPNNLKKFLIPNDPLREINIALSNSSFEELTERNKLIYIISSDLINKKIDESKFKEFKNKNYEKLIDDLEKQSNDKFLYHLLSKKFKFDDSSLITKSFSQKMFL